MSCFEDLLSLDTGSPIRIYNLALGLTRHGHKIKIIIPSIKEEIQYLNGIPIYKFKGTPMIYILKFFSNIISIKKHTSFFFYDLLFILKASRIILQSHVVQLEQPWAGGILIPFITKILRKPVIIDSHDVYQSLRIKDKHFMIQFIETFLENFAYRISNLILVVSNKEKKLLNRNGISKEKIVVIPNGVDTRIFSKKNQKNYYNLEKKLCIDNFWKVIFIGNMEYFPNQEAVNIIASKIAPKVQNKINKVKFLIVGRCPEKFRINDNNLIFTGVVKNVADYLNMSDVAIAPLLHGTGTRLKILEYFSCSLPVVSTHIGSEGLEVENTKNILIEHDFDRYSSRIVELLKNRELRIKIGKSARELVIEKYDWQNITEKLSKYYYAIFS